MLVTNRFDIRFYCQNIRTIFAISRRLELHMRCKNHKSIISKMTSKICTNPSTIYHDMTHQRSPQYSLFFSIKYLKSIYVRVRHFFFPLPHPGRIAAKFNSIKEIYMLVSLSLCSENNIKIMISYERRSGGTCARL